MTTTCTCCAQRLDPAVDDLAMELCELCLAPHATHRPDADAYELTEVAW